MKASFKISATLQSRQVLDAELYMKLFDSIVKPVALYGAQVWSDRFLSLFERHDLGAFDRLPFEKLQNKICKCALRVGKYTSNDASRAELGRYPLIISVAQIVVAFWCQILASPDKLVHSAYSEELKADSEGKRTWATLVRRILARCGLQRVWDAQSVSDNKQIQKQVRSELQRQFESSFFARLNAPTNPSGGGNKLRTYKSIKINYNIEKYLVIKNMPPHTKKALAKLRVSSHRLEIEMGRRTKPKPVPAAERFCKHCKVHVEDEVHFIVQCPLYEHLRVQMLRHCPVSLDQTSQKSLFKDLFTSDNSAVLGQLGIYICRAMAKRHCFLYS